MTNDPTKAPSKPSKPLPQNVWGFASEVLARLGPGLLVLAGVVYALWQFREQENRAMESFRQQVQDGQNERQAAVRDSQDLLKEANESLRESSRTIIALNKGVMENLSTGFKKIQELQKELEPLRKEAVEAQLAASVAIAALERAEKDRIKTEEGSAAKKLELEEITTELDEKKEDLAEAKRDFEKLQRKAIERYGEFRDDVEKLIEAIDSGSPNAESLANDIRTNHLIDTNGILAQFKAEPASMTKRQLAQLEGLKRDVLIDLVRVNSMGFESWVELQNAETSLVLGITEVTDHGTLDLISLVFSGDRVAYAVAGRDLTALSVPSERDWDERRLYVASTGSFEGELGVVDVGAVREGERISIDLTIEDVRLANPIYGKMPSFTPLPLEKLMDSDPKRVGRLVDLSESLFQAMRAIERARVFDADRVVAASIGEDVTSSAELRRALMRIVTAAVSKNATERSNVAAQGLTPTDWGQKSVLGGLHHRYFRAA